MKQLWALLIICFSYVAQSQNKTELIANINLKLDQEKVLDADALCDKLLHNFPFDDSIAILKSTIIDLKGNRADAIGYAYSSLNELPNSFHLLFYTGTLCMNSSLFDTSKVFFDRALKVAKNQDDSLGTLLNIASYFMYTNKVDSTIYILKNLISKDSTCIGCYSNLAMAYNSIKDYTSSILWMKKALKLDSTSSFICNNIGLALSEIGEYNEAIQYFNKGIQLNPKFAFCYSNLGYAYHKLGDNQKAIRNINTSLEYDNQNSWAYRNLALVYISQKKWKEVCIYLDRSIELGFDRFYGEEVNELLSKYCKGK
jgi:tetratricopeptide (TPR) repeat protein